MSLTTTKSEFIEKARTDGQLFIEQPYKLYSKENHQTWNLLYRRMLPLWEKNANSKFMEGLDMLGLQGLKVPKLKSINSFLKKKTGFQAIAVSGYIPAVEFFDCLKQRKFPTTITIRDKSTLDYLPEPDIFHDIAGHVPMHTHQAFADTLQKFGECSALAYDIVSSIKNKDAKLTQLINIQRALARFFWFSIEFGLMKENNKFKVYGSGLLSSFGEITHSIHSSNVSRKKFKIDDVINQEFDYNVFQKQLYYISSFDELFEKVIELEEYLKNKKLNNVITGKPEIDVENLRSKL